MDEVLGSALEWWRQGSAIGLATVVSSRGSTPRPIGASMLVGPDSTVVGSVSGGCVEGAVFELAQEVIADGSPVLERYGYSDDEALAVGLTCGGELDVFVQRIDQSSFPDLDLLVGDINAGRPVALATVIEHPNERVRGARLPVRPAEVSPNKGAPALIGVVADAALRADVAGMLASGDSGPLEYGPKGERLGQGMTVFVQSWAPRARMIVFGAIDFAAAVCRLGSHLGFDVTVCDARPVFATAPRFPDADRVVVDWPHRYLAAESEAGSIDERTVVVVLTHDPKFDVPVLELALRLPLAYVGAMGSRRTHLERLGRLAQAGVSTAELARLHSPIGLDLGARTPEETAVSIAAEIVANRWGGTGVPLGRLDGPIHTAVTMDPPGASERASA